MPILQIPGSPSHLPNAIWLLLISLRKDNDVTAESKPAQVKVVLEFWSFFTILLNLDKVNIPVIHGYFKNGFTESG